MPIKIIQPNSNEEVNTVNYIYQDILFIFSAGCTVFLIYIFVYVLRRSFTASTFDGYMLWGLEYKQILIITQCIGYFISKLIGIKIISELRKKHRLFLLLLSTCCSLFSLICFGLISYPYNFITFFFNGLFLGCMWGILFSYIEGRRFTDILALILGMSIILGSGVAKTFGLYILSFNASPFWMPAIAGLFILPLLVIMSVFLEKLPQPTPHEEKIKMDRKPLKHKQRINIINKYSVILIPLLTINILCTVIRDIKEDFLVDIIDNLNISYNPSLFLKTDTIVSILILIILASTTVLKRECNTLYTLLGIMLVGTVVFFLTSLLFNTFPTYPFLWLLTHSFGLYLVYLIFQTILFERWIIDHKISGNVGFFMYVSDSLGYFFSCLFLLGKSFLNVSTSWAQYYNILSMGISLIFILLIITIFFILKSRKYNV